MVTSVSFNSGCWQSAPFWKMEYQMCFWEILGTPSESLQVSSTGKTVEREWRDNWVKLVRVGTHGHRTLMLSNFMLRTVILDDKTPE